MENIEYEAKFINIDKGKIRKTLRVLGANLINPEFLQKRVVFNLPTGHEIKGGWIRIRDEANKITMSLKVISGNKIEDQKEVYLIVNSFEEAEKFLMTIGCKKKSYQENKRELWRIKDVEITIDEWPFVEPFIEIESDSEDKVKEVAKNLGFNYTQALFGATDIICQKKYGIPLDVINSMPEIRFDMANPYLALTNLKV